MSDNLKLIIFSKVVDVPFDIYVFLLPCYAVLSMIWTGGRYFHLSWLAPVFPDSEKYFTNLINNAKQDNKVPNYVC